MNQDQSLNRFLTAQQNIYPQVIKELQNGNKTSHWMWFIFPQIAGLGMSPTSQFYAIKNIEEAKEYLQHPALAERLKECCDILLNLNGRTAKQIFGSVDEIKLRSCITLFDYVSNEENVFKNVLQKYFAGERDQKTIALLGVGNL